MSLIENFNQVCLSEINAWVNIPFILYTHIPAAIICLMVGFFVFRNTKTLTSRILLSLSLVFSTFIIFNLISWLTSIVPTLLFFWSFFGLVISLIFILCVYLLYVFLFDKDVSLRIKYIFLVLLLPVIFLTPTNFSITSFDGSYCVVNEGSLFMYYYYSFGILSALISIVLWVKSRRNNNSDHERRKYILFTIGIELFILMLFFTSVIASYLYDTGFVSSYNLEPYGLFGAIVFMSILAYLIVKFKAFNIKLIGAQALVWFLVIVVGAQFLYVVGITSIILTLLTLIVSSVLGLILVRSVKKEISQREHIEKLAGELQVANKGQENLIHIMNHQIKGFLGITRNIFAELLQGEDYGVMPDPAKPLLEKGLETTVKGVDYVQAILRGASAEKGTLTYDMKPINVRDIVSELISKQKSIVEKAGLAFESKIGDGLYGIVGDAIHIKEAFKNLITNAIKYNDYTYPDRSVRVDLEREGSNIVFSVRDTGIGIKDEDKPRMFTAGGAGKDSLKYNVESSGFGLSYVKGVVEYHGGKVGFKSNAPEKGTTFFIKIPVDAK